MSQHAVDYDARGRRLVAPIGLLLAVGLIAVATWHLAPELTVRPVTIPVAATETAPDAIPERGPQVLVVVRGDGPSAEVVDLVEALTTELAAEPGVRRVESPTDVGVVTTVPPGVLVATPPFGSSSRLDPDVTAGERTRRAADGQLGTAGMVSDDGTTFLVAAELDPQASAAQQDATAEAVRARATAVARDSGADAELTFAGAAMNAAEAGVDVRSDLWLLVGLAVLLPAAIALVVLRRRVPAGALLAAGGGALLLAAILVNNESAQGRTAALERDHPVAVADDVVDRDLRGTVPVTVDITGAPGAFRRPDVLARLDALSTWLREEYGLTATDLTTTLRAEAAAITGVDSLPSQPEDIENLLRQAEAFDGGAHLSRLANEDFSRTRIVAWMPDQGRARLEELANRLDRISVLVFDDLGVSVRVGSDIVASAAAREQLASDLALLGLLAVALAAVVALATLWDRHRHEEIYRAQQRRLAGHGARRRSAAGAADGDAGGERRWRESLFARHGHRIRAEGTTVPPARDDDDDDDRFDRPGRPRAGSR